jgi:hypothetical protein
MWNDDDDDPMQVDGEEEGGIETLNEKKGSKNYK